MSAPDPDPAPQCIVLIGFMGSGKTTVGRVLAHQLGWKFCDTDHRVVKTAGKEIPRIFAEDGEDAFRKIESGVLNSLAGSDRIVVATGGGVVTRPENIPLLRAIGFVVWLDAPEEDIFQRVSRNKKRPLLQTENPRETVRTLLATRAPLYQSAADCVIQTHGFNWHSVIRIIHQRADQYFSNPPPA